MAEFEVTGAQLNEHEKSLPNAAAAFTDLVVSDYAKISAAPEIFGGKAAQLAQLSLFGYRVPRFFVIPCDVVASLGTGNLDSTQLLASVRQACDRLQLTDIPLAVRSSATCEDGKEHSFAGMFSSVLNVRGARGLGAAIKKVQDSLNSSSVTEYCKLMGLATSPAMAIVIQEMIDPEISGVAFSRDPTGAELNCVLVEAVFGLGEGLVGGDLNADRGWVDRSNVNIQKMSACEKAEAYRCLSGGGTIKEALPSSQRKVSALTPAILSEVSRACLDIELDFAETMVVDGPSQAIDMEWCYHKKQLYMLQVRPVTAAAPLIAHVTSSEASIKGKTAAVEGPKVLWDNANIVESYSGLVAPLTFSHARRAYRQVYEEFSRVMGVPKTIIASERELFGNMLGLLQGHVYYNLLNWYRLLSLFPNAERSAGFMETMMGVKEELGDQSAAEFFASVRSPYTPSPLRKVWLAAIAIFRLLTLKRRMANFEHGVNATCDEAMAKNYEQLSVPAQFAAYESLCQKFLANWQAPIINDMRCMLLFGSLKRLGAKWLGESFDLNQVVRGHGPLGSAEPVQRLKFIAECIYKGYLPGLAWLSTVDLNQAYDELCVNDELLPLRLEVEAYRAEFGFRCPEELKLEANDLYIDPTPIFQNLVAYVEQLNLHGGPTQRPVVEGDSPGEALRDLPFGRRLVMRLLINHTAKAIADRERLRLVRGRTFSVARKIFRAMGNKLAALDLLSSMTDIFYLTVEELADVVYGRGATDDLASLASQRRQEYVHFGAQPSPPERFVTEGVPAAALSRRTASPELQCLAGASRQANAWKGTPCYPGVVRGKAMVAANFGDASKVQGEILVAKSTDPGWVVLFPRCSALVIERGSLLSHSAVVARELGVPTIVGVTGITTELESGAEIHVDAGKGSVQLVAERDAG